jgi:adenylate cyclase
MQAVRGIAAPIEVFKLTGLLNAPASDAFRSGKRLTSLIGRSEQVAALESELAHAIKGDGRVVGVVGDAGIGKSRLCFEFAENCRRQGIRVYEARVLAHGRATPFQPVLELLRDIFGIRPRDSVETSRRRVIERFRPNRLFRAAAFAPAGISRSFGPAASAAEARPACAEAAVARSGPNAGARAVR